MHTLPLPLPQPSIIKSDSLISLNSVVVSTIYSIISDPSISNGSPFSPVHLSLLSWNSKFLIFLNSQVSRFLTVSLLEFLCWQDEILAGLKKDETMMHK